MFLEDWPNRFLDLVAGNVKIKGYVLTVPCDRCTVMVRDYRFNDRLDFAMGIMAFAGAGVAILIPFVLIFASIFFQFPYLEVIVLACQVGGCIMIGISLGYFICRKEM